MTKLYDEERNAFELDKAGGYYSKHIVAMTKEGLHSKSDIATELAYRDMVIDELKAQVEQLESAKLQWYRRGVERCIDKIIELGILCESGTIIGQLRQQVEEQKNEH